MDKKRRPGHLKRYAKHAGIAVSSAAEQLQRVGIDYSQMFDFTEADRLREASRHAARAPFAKPIVSDPLADDELDDQAKKDETILSYQREREKWKAKLAKLDYEERIAELIPAEEVDQEWFRIGRIVRDTLKNIGPRLRAQLAAESDPFKCEQMIDEETDRVLEVMNDRVMNLEEVA